VTNITLILSCEFSPRFYTTQHEYSKPPHKPLPSKMALTFRDFSSVVRRLPGYNAKRGHGPHSPSDTAALPKCLPTLACLRLAIMPLWVQTPDNLPTKVCPPPPKNNKTCFCQHYSLLRPGRGLQDDGKYSALANPQLIKVSVIEPSDTLKRRKG
jgi:hypothetical protein